MDARQVVGVDLELIWADGLWRLENLPDVKGCQIVGIDSDLVAMVDCPLAKDMITI
jgi:hypothetical protein